MAMIVGYTVCKHLVNTEKIEPTKTSRGIYFTYENARNAMEMQVEEFCMRKAGIDNFQKGQYRDPSLSSKIKYGLIISVLPNTEVCVSKRSSIIFSDTPLAYFSILPLIREKTLVEENSQFSTIGDDLKVSLLSYSPQGKVPTISDIYNLAVGVNASNEGYYSSETTTNFYNDIPIIDITAVTPGPENIVEENYPEVEEEITETSPEDVEITPPEIDQRSCMTNRAVRFATDHQHSELITSLCGDLEREFVKRGIRRGQEKDD